ncbi:MAG: hypothetical protein AUJ52_05810 [Elusimicrobia bacterium CG1_02_63_36]|nr:MAG: hypothetical protein AUJ52_05810 [Elusimicrobia bacterium CG1_02_63_36]
MKRFGTGDKISSKPSAHWRSLITGDSMRKKDILHYFHIAWTTCSYRKTRLSDEYGSQGYLESIRQFSRTWQTARSRYRSRPELLRI